MSTCLPALACRAPTWPTLTTLLLAALCLSGPASAAVSAAEAEALKSTLTPLGAEKAGNADGSIPAWTGGLTTPTPGFVNGGKRPDPFATEKPLYSVTARNMAAHADKLSEGTKALLKRYPDTYRLDVYPAHRTAAAPQWVYDHTLRNATRARIVPSAYGGGPEGAFGGIPFPIPKTGVEVVWNHLLRWRGTSWHTDVTGFLVTADGRKVQILDSVGDQLMPYYQKALASDKFTGDYWLIRLLNAGPPIRAGEGIVGRNSLDGEDNAWVYLTGQRRVRKLPNACCDTPNAAAGGMITFDDVEVFTGRTDRFDWKLLGKQELLIPYNSNRTLAPTADELLGPHHLNPDHVRWELHRVWRVEATLREGQRHQAARSVYYFDEDTWNGVLADRWDARGQLWKTLWQLPVAMPDIPATAGLSFGVYDLTAGTHFVNALFNGKAEQYKVTAPKPDSVYTPDGLINDAVR